MKKYKHKQTGQIALLDGKVYKIKSDECVFAIPTCIIENSNDWELIPNIEVGKVYKDYNTFFMVLVKEVTINKCVRGIGFDTLGNWFELTTFIFDGNEVEATKEEWFERLKEEAFKRGLVKGVKFESPYKNRVSFISQYYLENDLCLFSNGVLMDSNTGKWATVIEESKVNSNGILKVGNSSVYVGTPTAKLHVKGCTTSSSGMGTIHDVSKKPSNSITLGSPISEKTYIKGIEINERYSLAEIAEGLNNLNNSFDKAVKHVQDTYCDAHIHIPYLLIGDVAELIKITTGKEVDWRLLLKNK